MTKTEFKKVMNKAIEFQCKNEHKIANCRQGMRCRYSCINLSAAETFIRGENEMSRKIRSHYEIIFGFTGYPKTVDSELYSTDEVHTQTRLAMLELFKEICLTTKEYENF